MNLAFSFVLIYVMSNFLISDITKETIKSNLLLLISFLANVLISYTIYYFLIAKPLLAGEYSMTYSQTVDPNSSLTQIIKNALDFVGHIYSSLKGISNWLLYPILVTSTLANLWATIRLFKLRLNRGIVFLLSTMLLLIPFVVFFFSFGILSFLKYPLHNPRLFIGFAGVILLGNCCYVFLSHRLKPLSWLVVIPIAFCFVICISYANALRFQERFDNILYTNISTDLLSLGFKDNDVLILHGIQKSAPEVKLVEKKFPLIGILVPKYIYNNWFWGYVKLERYGIHAQVLSQAEYDAMVSSLHCGSNSPRKIYGEVCQFATDPKTIFLVHIK